MLTEEKGSPGISEGKHCYSAITIPSKKIISSDIF